MCRSGFVSWTEEIPSLNVVEAVRRWRYTPVRKVRFPVTTRGRSGSLSIRLTQGLWSA